MRTRNFIGFLTVAVGLAATVQAGPAISCHWVAVPGTVFESLSELRDRAMRADDSPKNGQAALAELKRLRAAAKPDDALSLLRAGFWATTMHSIRIAPDADGPAWIEQAVALLPNDPAYHFFAALANLHTDKAAFLEHWNRARELSEPGSAVAVNMKVVGDLYRDLID